MGIAAINIDAMTTAIMMTVGARTRCPRSQEHRRGAGGGAPDPDNWLATGTVSDGDGHGPILLGKSKRGGGTVWTHRPINSYVKLQGNFLPLAEIFYTGRVKTLGYW